MKSNLIASIPAGKREGYEIGSKTTEATLRKLGIGYSKPVMDQFIAIFGTKLAAMDVAPGLLTTPGVITPLQFLQVFLPNTIRTLTKARLIEELVATNIIGSWADEEVITKFLERTGRPRLYGDHADIPEASFNSEMEPRTIVRLELGMSTTILAAERASRLQINEAAEKREAISEAFAIELNAIGFYGYNDGSNRTFGFLNDPNLPPYQTVAPEDVGGTPVYTWLQKSFMGITRDFTRAFSDLRTKTGERIDPRSANITVAVSSSRREAMTNPNDYGYTVEKWLTENYPNVTIKSAPELDGANGGSNVMIVYVDRLDGNSVIDYNIVERFRLLGIEQRAKGVVEDYSCATAGVILNYPLGMVRFSGI